MDYELTEKPYPPLEKVLARVTSPQVVITANNKHKSYSLMKAVALETGEPESVILKRVAAILELEPLFDLQPIDYRLVELTGHEPGMLQSLRMLPQWSHCGYLLAVADPSIVSRERFEMLGISIRLAVAEQIDSLWASYLSVCPRNAEQELAFAEYIDYTQSLSAEFRTKKASLADLLLPF